MRFDNFRVYWVGAKPGGKSRWGFSVEISVVTLDQLTPLIKIMLLWSIMVLNFLIHDKMNIKMFVLQIMSLRFIIVTDNLILKMAKILVD